MKAQKLYSFLSENCENKHSNIFINLIAMEKIHEVKMRELYTLEFPEEDLQIEIKPINKQKTKNFSDPKQIFDFAMERENSAQQAYLDLAQQADDIELKNLFFKFSEEEKNHSELIYAEIERLTNTMVWFDESELNGFMDD